MNVTLEDIAKRVGVSIATVSMALSESPKRISQKRILQIRQIATEMNYIPNLTARGLATKSTKSIGVIIPDIENLFFSSLAKTIEYKLREKGYISLLLNSNENYCNELDSIRILVKRGVDGILLTISNESINHIEALKKELSALAVPYVLMDRVIPSLNCHKVYYDNRQGGYLMASHIFNYGHRKVGIITAKKFSQNGKERFLGIMDAAKEYNIKQKDIVIVEGKYRYLDGYDNAEKVIKKGVTAILASNDMMAYGALNRLYQLGYRVPEDVSLIGYDNISEILGMPITSVDQSTSKIGSHSVEILMNAINGDKEIKTVAMMPKIIDRNSTIAIYSKST